MQKRELIRKNDTQSPEKRKMQIPSLIQIFTSLMDKNAEMIREFFGSHKLSRTCLSCGMQIETCHHCVICGKTSGASECKNCFAPICPHHMEDRKTCPKCGRDPKILTNVHIGENKSLRELLKSDLGLE